VEVGCGVGECAGVGESGTESRVMNRSCMALSSVESLQLKTVVDGPSMEISSSNLFLSIVRLGVVCLSVQR
jgi:hypothetical protein